MTPTLPCPGNMSNMSDDDHNMDDDECYQQEVVTSSSVSKQHKLVVTLEALSSWWSVLTNPLCAQLVCLAVGNDYSNYKDFSLDITCQ
eukprot:5152578-Amphidinium_carterae.1